MGRAKDSRGSREVATAAASRTSVSLALGTRGAHSSLGCLPAVAVTHTSVGGPCTCNRKPHVGSGDGAGEFSPRAALHAGGRVRYTPLHVHGEDLRVASGL
jgi:hypothetical protein